MIQMSNNLDGYIGRESRLGETEIQCQRDVYQLLKSKSELDDKTIMALHALSIEMSASYEVAVQEVARIQGWPLKGVDGRDKPGHDCE
jgi:hypothetical protein